MFIGGNSKHHINLVSMLFYCCVVEMLYRVSDEVVAKQALHFGNISHLWAVSIGKYNASVCMNLKNLCYFH
jgi:hypothetical protein